MVSRPFEWTGLGRLLSVVVVASTSLFAQTNSKVLDLNQHGWLFYSGEHRVSPNWGIHFDTQLRRSDVLATWQQILLRPGLNYWINPDLMLTVGYTYAKTYRYGDFPAAAAFPEHRMYQQVQQRHRRKSVTLTQRHRVEQRWVQYPTNPGETFTYQNRYRFSLRAEFPLTRKPSGSSAWYLPISNEIFLGIPPNFGARTFDQNRLFAGIGYAVAPAANLEVGYMKQFIGQRNGRIFEFNNTLVVSVSSNYDLSKLWSD